MKILRYLDSHGRTQFASETPDGSVLRIEGDIYGAFNVTGEPAQIFELLAPVVAPPRFSALASTTANTPRKPERNFPSAPCSSSKELTPFPHPNQPIQLPRHLRSDEVDYECELAVVIGKPCKNVSREHALDYVLGYTCANDVSARDHQIWLGGGQWCRGKFFDTFAPLGPRLVTAEEIPNPNAMRIRTELHGETVQDSHTSDMAFDVATIISYLSGSTTLTPGTVILTGTPSGVGMAAKPGPRWLQPGDVVTIDIEGIGGLTNAVEEEK